MRYESALAELPRNIEKIQRTAPLVTPGQDGQTGHLTRRCTASPPGATLFEPKGYGWAARGERGR
jgi:hypothetical protein